ncbi:hypothetical protein [Streptomyces sp. SID14515]|uniref:hypothetical protein n=1 Tax=Streptomyces sp. SID14515 TaxID=2706074 RepID=UPI001EF3505F|nr:hypothetical protein [Streptomyces sp. SID14515]
MQQQEANKAGELGMVKILSKISPLQVVRRGEPVKPITHPKFSRVLHDGSPRPPQGSLSRSEPRGN